MNPLRKRLLPVWAAIMSAPRVMRSQLRMVRFMAIVVLVSITSTIGLAVLAERLGVTVDGSLRSRAAIGVQVAGKIAQRLGAQGDSDTKGPLKASRHGIRLTGGVFQVDTKDQARVLISRIRQAGGTITTDPEGADALLSWDETSGWTIRAGPSPGRAGVTYLALVDLATEDWQARMAQVQADRGVARVTTHDITGSTKSGKAIGIYAVMAVIGIMGPLFFLTYAGISSCGITMDNRRKAGELEPYANTTSPLWSFVLADALGRGLITCAMSGLVIGVGAAFFGLHSGLAVALFLVSQFALVVCLGLAGSLQVIWFKHKVLQTVFGMMLNFTVMPTIPLFYLAFSRRYEGVVERGMDNLGNLGSERVIPVLDWTAAQALRGAGIMIPVALVVGLVAAKLMTWRVRRHRYHLSQ